MTSETPRIIRFGSLTPEPWRNGGGTTVELATGRIPADKTPHTANATDKEDWDWRLSVADITRPGEFSRFEGMERVLTVVSGEFLLLSVDGREHGLEPFRPFRFDGDAESAAELPAGPVQDLGLITRTEHCRGYVTIVELSRKRALDLLPGRIAVLIKGAATLTAETAPDEFAVPGEELALLDTVITSSHTASLTGRGLLAVISIESVDPLGLSD